MLSDVWRNWCGVALTPARCAAGRKTSRLKLLAFSGSPVNVAKIGSSSAAKSVVDLS
jgi:hypothetical protein